MRRKSFPALPGDRRRTKESAGSPPCRTGSGALNDGAVAETLLADWGANSGRLAFATGLVAGFAGAQGGRARERIARAWQNFTMEPFWD